MAPNSCDGAEHIVVMNNSFIMGLFVFKSHGKGTGIWPWYSFQKPVMVSMDGATIGCSGDKGRLCPSHFPCPPLVKLLKKASFNCLPLTTLQFNTKQLNK